MEILKKIPVPKIVVLAITTVIILFFLFRSVGQIDPANILENANIYYILLALAVGLITFLLSASRWFWLVKMAGYNINFQKIFSLVSSSFALSLIPGRLGDFARTYPLRDEIAMTEGVGTIILEKIIDIISLLLLAFLGFLFLGQMKWALVAMALIIAILLIIKISRQLYHRLNKQAQIIDQLWQILEKIKNRPKYFFLAMLSSLINWLISIIMTVILFKAFGQEVSLATIMAYLPFAIFIGLIPISIAGLGTRESALVWLLSLQNIPTNITLLVGLLYSFISYFIFSLVGIPFFIKEFKKP